jgi:hypothetical protein
MLGKNLRLVSPKPMPQLFESASGLRRLFRRRRAYPVADWEKAREQERAASLAILRMRQEDELRAQRLRGLLALWPVAVGLLLGIMAPTLQQVAQSFGPWGMPLVFPFVVLAQRPEIQVGPFTHTLPTIMLYGQFPLEGWLARIVLRRRIRLFSVAGHVLLFHFLGVIELLMLSGVAYEILRYTGIHAPQ